jgi:phosphoglycolate phosphatase
MKYKAVLFDLDGTLINTLDDLTDVMNMTLAEFDAGSITPQQCRPLLGIGLRHLCEHSLPPQKRDLTDKFMARYRELYSQHYLEKSTPYEGVVQMVSELDVRGIKMAVVTNKNEDISSVMIEQVFGNELFPVVRGAVNGIGCKPDPKVVFEVLERFEVAPRQTLFVGDGEADLDVAKNAGIESVWVSWGFRSLNELEGRVPDYRLDHPCEILELL